MIFGITGAADAGKTTAARFLAKNHGFIVLEMPDPLKDMLAALYRRFGLSKEEIDRRLHGDLKRAPCPFLGGRSPTYAMQQLGHDWGRVRIDVDLWARCWGAQVGRLPASSRIANSSIRYRNEAEQVRRYGGYMLRIHREQIGFDDLDRTHASEQEWATMPVDFELHNDGTERDLERAIANIVEDLE